MARVLHLRRCALPASLLLVLSMLTLAAGKKMPARTPVPEEATPAAPGARLRIWKGEFLSQRGVRVTVRTLGRKPATKDFERLDHGYHFTEYSAVPAEDAVLEIFDDATPPVKLKSLPLHFAPEDQATLLLSEANGQLGSELIYDIALPSENPVAELTVRNFVPTLASLQVTIGDDVKVDLRSPQSVLQVRGLRRQVLQVDTAGQQEIGKPLRWTNEVDFNRFPKATLLIYPDPYGRIRPRLIVDGEIRGKEIPGQDAGR